MDICFPVHILPDTLHDLAYGLGPVLLNQNQGDIVHYRVEVTSKDGTYPKVFYKCVRPQNNQAHQIRLNALPDLSANSIMDAEIGVSNSEMTFGVRNNSSGIR